MKYTARVAHALSDEHLTKRGYFLLPGCCTFAVSLFICLKQTSDVLVSVGVEIRSGFLR